MRKTLGIFTLCLVIILSLSAGIKGIEDTTPGTKAPEFTINVSGLQAVRKTINLKQLTSGRYTLINFWDSTNAGSRVMTSRYDDIFKSLDSNRIQLLSLNLDNNSTLFDEISRLDKLSESNQFHVEGKAASMLKDLYHLNEGYKAVLLDPSGTIIAIDPTIEQLTQLS